MNTWLKVQAIFIVDVCLLPDMVTITMYLADPVSMSYIRILDRVI